MRIRKQVDELTLADLADHPVWEFALDEEGEEDQDETTVRPILMGRVVNPSDGTLLVRASFTLRDGSKRRGFVTLPFEGHACLGTIQPVVVTDGGLVGFWCGVIEPEPEQLASDYQRLKTDAENAFPIRFESDLPTVDGPIVGTVDGFYVLEDWTSGATRIIR